MPWWGRLRHEKGGDISAGMGFCGGFYRGARGGWRYVPRACAGRSGGGEMRPYRKGFGARCAWRAAFRGRRIPRNKRRGALAWEKGEIFPRGAGRSGADSADAWKRIWRAVRMESRFSGDGGYPETSAAGFSHGKRGRYFRRCAGCFPAGICFFAVGFIGVRGGWRYVPRACAGRSGADSTDA